MELNTYNEIKRRWQQDWTLNMCIRDFNRDNNTNITVQEFRDLEKELDNGVGRYDESFCIQINDAHDQDVTASYNHKICLDRFDSLKNHLQDIIDAEKITHKFTEGRILLIGDNVGGFGVYPTQAHHLEETSVLRQVEKHLEDVLIPFVDWMLASFKKVVIDAVAGNHSFIGRFLAENDNAENILFSLLKKHYRQSRRVEINADGYLVRYTTIQNNGHILYHGQDVKSFLNMPWYGIMTKFRQWISSVKEPWVYGHMGHFHQACQDLPIDNTHRVMIGGTMKTDDEYSFRRYNKDGDAKWYAWTERENLPCQSVHPIILTQDDNFETGGSVYGKRLP